MDQFWGIINSPFVSLLWKISTLGYLVAAVIALHYFKEFLKQYKEMLVAIRATQSDIRVLMETREDHGDRINRIEDRLFETGSRGRRRT
jgi:hypothetical protein